MRRRFAAIVLIMVLLSGCSNYTPFVRLEQRIMVQLIGIDIQDGVYSVTVQFSMGKTSDGGKTENDLKTVTGTGDTVYSAIKQARAGIGKEFFFTHTQVLFLGEEVVKYNAIKAIEDYLLYCDEHSAALVAGVYGKAEDILNLTFKDEYSDKNKLLLVLENANNNGIYPAFPIYRTLMDAYSASGSFFLPMIQEVQAEENEGGDNSSVDSGGGEGGDSGGGGDSESGGGDSGGSGGSEQETPPKVMPMGGALIIDGQIAGFMDEQQCAGLATFVCCTNVSSIDFLYDDTPSTLEIFNLNTRISPGFDGEKLRFRVTFTASSSEAYNPILTQVDVEEFRKVATEALKKRLESSLEFVTGLGGDLFMLEDWLKHLDYRLWKKVESNWCQHLRDAEFVYTIDIAN